MDSHSDSDGDGHDAATEAGTDYGSTFEADSEYDSDAAGAMQSMLGIDSLQIPGSARASAQVCWRTSSVLLTACSTVPRADAALACNA